MKRKIIYTVLFTLTFLLAGAQKRGMLFIDSDSIKYYNVNMSIDTVLSYNQSLLVPDFGVKLPEYEKQYKIQFDFTILYFWSHNYSVRVVAKEVDSIYVKLNVPNKIYPLSSIYYVAQTNTNILNAPYEENKHNQIKYYPIGDTIQYENFYGYIFKIKEGFSIKFYEVYTLDFYYCNPSLEQNNCDLMYYKYGNHYWNKMIQFNKNIFWKVNNIPGEIKFNIMESLFSYGSDEVFIASLPIKYAKYKTSNLKNRIFRSCNEGGNRNIKISKVYNVQGKAIYKIILAEKRKYIYIPHVLYLSANAQFNFHINSISGKSLKDFMSNYNDDFNPTLMPTKPTTINLQDFFPTKDINNTDKEPAFIVVEENASFQGGDLGSFRNWVQEKLVYPQQSFENGSQGRVFIQFAVNSKGDICDIKVLRSTGDPLLDNEAIRVIKTSPQWKPARQGGANVRQQFTMPVTFKLEQ